MTKRRSSAHHSRGKKERLLRYVLRKQPLTFLTVAELICLVVLASLFGIFIHLYLAKTGQNEKYDKEDRILGNMTNSITFAHCSYVLSKNFTTEFCEKRIDVESYAWRHFKLNSSETDPSCIDLQEQVKCHESVERVERIIENAFNQTKYGGCAGLNELTMPNAESPNKEIKYPVMTESQLSEIRNKTILAQELFVVCPSPDGMRLKINGKWFELDKDFIAKHPGGSVITQYRDADATHIFHAFHEGSASAYKQMKILEKTKAIKLPGNDPTEQFVVNPKDVNVYSYDITIEQEKNIVLNFEKLRQTVHDEGLMDIRPWFFARKIAETMSLMFLGFYLQYLGYYIASACSIALAWQQLGWLTHEFCHHQPFKNRKLNDLGSLFLGNFAQGFSRDWWKDKHNTHHAATNVIDQDGDIDLAPLVAMVPEDLLKYREPIETFILKIVPYQHLYFTMMLPLLRFSWCSQSIVHVFTANGSEYLKDRQHALGEQLALIGHWMWVILQLYLLPTNFIRFVYFMITQCGAGFLVAHVVTYNHNSVDKFPENSRVLNNFAALNIMGTRNMNPSPFIDWLWGGLNYQIEHHLFPTMPRPNLTRCSQLVKEFCENNNLPYMVDDYWTGYEENLRQLENMAKVVELKLQKSET